MHYRKKDDLIVIKYGAVWCGPCKRLGPIITKLAKEHLHVYFLDVDTETEGICDHEDLKDITKIPHVKLFYNKEMKREIKGFDPENLIRYVERYSALKLEEDKENISEVTLVPNKVIRTSSKQVISPEEKPEPKPALIEQDVN